MKRRTRHTPLLIGVPLLLMLALGGWTIDAIRKPFSLLGYLAARGADARITRPKSAQRQDFRRHHDRASAPRHHRSRNRGSSPATATARVPGRGRADRLGRHPATLWETLDDLRACGEELLGGTTDGTLVGAISWRYGAGTIDIHRLVVDPDHFRRGIATALVRRALEAAPAAERAIVQTGTENAPAAGLYEREGLRRPEDLELDRVRVSRFAKRLR